MGNDVGGQKWKTKEKDMKTTVEKNKKEDMER
jgi:hypothetical protein